MSRTGLMLVGAMVLLSSAVGCEARDDAGGARGRTPGASVPAPTPATGAAVDEAARRAPAAVETTHAAGRQGTTGTGRREVAGARPAPMPAGAGAGHALAAADGHPRRVTLGTLDLTGVGHDEGSATAPVVLIDFSDFGCPYCGEFARETYPAIQREYVRTGKVFFKYVPFIVGMFPHAAEAARAAECAGNQGRFWPMVNQVYDAQKVWKGGGDPRPLLTGMAGAVGADTARFSECYADRRTDSRTARATDVAATVGVRVTPSFLVNERPIQGALPLADFRRVLDAALLVAGTRR